MVRGVADPPGQRGVGGLELGQPVLDLRRRQVVRQRLGGERRVDRLRVEAQRPQQCDLGFAPDHVERAALGVDVGDVEAAQLQLVEQLARLLLEADPQPDRRAGGRHGRPGRRLVRLHRWGGQVGGREEDEEERADGGQEGHDKPATGAHGGLRRGNRALFTAI
ncbi:MAG: hypothetical protein MUF27_05005 [Acidobacteria bacterium]|nr:hypothetical protein [Acidobacteriota bacterium]